MTGSLPKPINMTFWRILVLVGLLGAVPAGYALSQPAMIWLRPNSYGVEVVGTRIVAGPEFEFMQWLSARLGQYQHRYESYPLKRNWHLVKTNQKPDHAYCFFGASKNAERESWGYFTQPTTILLPYPVAAKQGSLDGFVENNRVSVTQLLNAGKSTVLVEGARNMWTDLLETAAQHDKSKATIIRITPGARSVAEQTAQLLKKDRIDFGYVGSGYDEISRLEQILEMQLSVYQVAEFAGNIRGGNRILCEKTDLGLRIRNDINEALNTIAEEPHLEQQYRDLNFKVIGYHPSLKAVFDEAWQSQFALEE